MSGGSLDHNRISLNVASELSDRLGGGKCQTYINAVKVMVRTLSDENFYYPDVVVTCDPNDDNDYFLESPTTIFEVLSPSTENNDRKDKYFAYRTLASLEEYVLISQDRREVTITRRSSGWEPEVLKGAGFELPVVGGKVALMSDRIYRGVVFED
jgi:Uma2 family endonuclease